MEIRIGIKHSPEVLAFETDTDQETVQQAVRAAYANSDSFVLFSDKKKREYLVPLESLAYIEFGAETPRKAGFIN